MPEFTPSVNEAQEFLEISSDFGDPKEIVREAISNSYDAGATEIEIKAVIDKSRGEDELVITISDNGEGMSIKELENFFGLGYTNRVKKDALGRKISDAIGEKGHGTIIYFNSQSIEVTTIKDGKRIVANLKEPKKNLKLGKIPPVKYSERKIAKLGNGTKVTVRGYNDNNQGGFGHDEIKDYIFWKTRFGSFEKAVGKYKKRKVAIKLAGIDWQDAEAENLIFGHPFPKVSSNLRELRKKDKVAPLDYYVAKWSFPGIRVIDFPSATLDFVFYIEGDKAKKAYNKMIHEARTIWKSGQYNVQERYGLWLTKDYIPIERRNTWVAEKTEWTKYHAFVNCQEFKLTANRGELGNTPPDLMNAVEKTIREVFEKNIKSSPEFLKYLGELRKEEVFRSAELEEKDYNRRRKEALKKKTANYKNITLFEPRQESGVFSLVLQLLSVKPDLFDFKIIDYDTSIGYDLLVTKDFNLDLNKASMRFVEMKYELKRDFNHSFKKLASVICWDTKLANDDEVLDLTGEKRVLRITPPKDKGSTTKYMLVSDYESHNIELFVLKDFFKEKLKLEFRPRTKEV
jgi:hypothetical protein